MKKVILTISALMIGAMISTGAFATVPDLIPVQGVLADSADLPIDALTDMTFTLYDGEASSTVLWTDTFVDVDVVEGFFTVYLGDNTALDFGSLITNSEVWVGITVESDPEMDRFQLATVPFAIEAQVSQQVGSLTESDIITTSDPAGGITSTQVSNWDTAYGWGDHGAVGYLTSYTETDPVYSAAPAAGIAAADITAWNTAVTWGPHVGLYAPIAHNHDATYVNEGQANSITSAMIVDSAITAADLATNSVYAAEIAAGAVGTSEVADNTLTANDLAASSVGTSEVADNSLTASDLAADSVGASELANNSVASANIIDRTIVEQDVQMQHAGSFTSTTLTIYRSYYIDDSGGVANARILVSQGGSYGLGSNSGGCTIQVRDGGVTIDTWTDSGGLRPWTYLSPQFSFSQDIDVYVAATTGNTCYIRSIDLIPVL